MELVSLFGFDITGSILSDVTIFAVIDIISNLVTDVGDELLDLRRFWPFVSPIF